MRTAYFGGGGGGGGSVTSFNGRTGAVVPASGDYTTTQITNDSIQNGGAGTLDDALNTLGPFGVIVANLAGRNAVPASQRFSGLTVYQVDTDQIWRLIGGVLNANYVDVTVTLVSNSAAGIVPAVGATSFILQSTGTASNWVAPLTWASTFVAPTIQQQSTGSATGQPLNVKGQNALTTGGALALATGTGATIGGALTMAIGTTGFASFQLSDSSDFLAFGQQASNHTALTGRIRLPPGVNIVSRSFDFSTDQNVYVSSTSGSGQTFGSTSGNPVRLQGATLALSVGAGPTDILTISTTQFVVVVPTITLQVPNVVVTTVGATAGFSFTITNDSSGANAGGFFRIRAMGTSSGNTNGNDVQIESGKGNGTGRSGKVSLKLNLDDTQANMSTMVQLALVATGQRILSTNFPGTAGAGITATQMPANTGDLVEFIGDAATIPSANGVGGHIYYSDGAKPAWRFNGTNFRFNGTSASATAGGGGALPVTVDSYLDVQVGGVQKKIPLYAA